MIFGTTTTEIGDEIIINAVLSRNGVYDINNFSDDVSDNDFTKYVSISINGEEFSAYEEFTNTNLTPVYVICEVKPLSPLRYKFKYVRKTNDEVTINAITLYGTLEITRNKLLLIHNIKVSGLPVSI